ncbi:MAG: hypothetical protein BWY83_03437 [bacterium ADurb.Bin478]|nr:MAG: hypothetical protein BWY83_03437 [bacterium ADurb.Bin478]
MAPLLRVLTMCTVSRSSAMSRISPVATVEYIKPPRWLSSSGFSSNSSRL